MTETTTLGYPRVCVCSPQQPLAVVHFFSTRNKKSATISRHQSRGITPVGIAAAVVVIALPLAAVCGKRNRCCVSRLRPRPSSPATPTDPTHHAVPKIAVLISIYDTSKNTLLPLLLLHRLLQIYGWLAAAPAPDAGAASLRFPSQVTVV